MNTPVLNYVHIHKTTNSIALCLPMLKTLTLFFPQDGWLLPGIEQKVLAWMTLGHDQISHSSLMYNSTTNTLYIQDDTLRLRGRVITV